MYILNRRGSDADKQVIRQVMRDKSVTASFYGKSNRKAEGKRSQFQTDEPPNMSFDKAVEMLSVLGYEVVIQERRPGARRAEQSVIDQKEG